MNNHSVDQLILETVDRLCREELPKFQNESYYNTVPRELFNSLSSLGLAGLSIAEEQRGMAASAQTIAAIFETMARYDAGVAIFLSVHTMVSGLLNRFASISQRADILPKLASGELLGAFALTEPQAGSDAYAITTEATRVVGGFSLTGSKCYITSAGFADLYLVFARTTTASGQGISAFAVPANSSGLTITPPEKKMGAELSPIASIYFDGVMLPETALVGELHCGFKVALSGLAGGRVNIAACANGISKAAIDAAIKHIKERKQFGRALAEFQALQFILADMHQKLEASRLLTIKAASDLDSANNSVGAVANVKLSSSTAKCFATDSAMSITTDAVQLFGGAGYIKEYTVERYMRDAKMLQIVEGTNQIQRMIIAKEILG